MSGGVHPLREHAARQADIGVRWDDWPSRREAVASVASVINGLFGAVWEPNGHCDVFCWEWVLDPNGAIAIDRATKSFVFWMVVRKEVVANHQVGVQLRGDFKCAVIGNRPQAMTNSAHVGFMEDGCGEFFCVDVVKVNRLLKRLFGVIILPTGLSDVGRSAIGERQVGQAEQGERYTDRGYPLTVFEQLCHDGSSRK